MDATRSPVHSVGYETGFTASSASDETPAYGRDHLAGALGAPLTAAGDNWERCGEDRISMTPESRFVFDGTMQIVFLGGKKRCGWQLGNSLTHRRHLYAEEKVTDKKKSSPGRSLQLRKRCDLHIMISWPWQPPPDTWKHTDIIIKSTVIKEKHDSPGSGRIKSRSSSVNQRRDFAAV